MRLVLSIFASLIVSAIAFMIVKFWGMSQVFIDYKHPFYTLAEEQKTPLLFLDLYDNWSLETSEKKFIELQFQGIYVHVAVTSDQKTVVLKKPIQMVRKFKYSEIQNDVYTAAEVKQFFKGKRVVLNFLENPISGPELIQEFLKESDLIQNNLFAILSPYDPPMRFLKEQQPTFLFGTTQPEILRIKALESIGLAEATTFRADLVVHEWDFYGEPFFSDTLVKEMSKRFKRLVVGPVEQAQWEDLNTNEKIRSINPFIVVVR